MYPFPIAKGAMAVELTTRVLNADRDATAAAARVLGDGRLVAFPTETVYGLGADATNGEAVARLYAAKGRPAFNPLIAHIGSIDLAHRLGRFDANAERLPAAVWPRPPPPGGPRAAGFSPPALPPARPAHAGRPAAAGFPDQRSRARRARYRRAEEACPSGRASFTAGVRRADRRAIGQSLRTCLADRGRTRARRSGGPRRSGARRRS